MTLFFKVRLMISGEKQANISSAFFPIALSSDYRRLPVLQKNLELTFGI